MIDLESEAWAGVKASPGGDGRLTAQLLRRLRDGADEDAWAELHHQVCHQGSVGETAYVAAPHMVAIAKRSDPHIQSLLLATLGSVVSSRECYKRGAPAVHAEWRSDFEQACRDARALAAAALAEVVPNSDDSFALLLALAAFHGHSNLALLMEGGPSLTCPDCGEYIDYAEA